MTRVYISGPMTGLPDLNFPAFHRAAAELRAAGYDVVNPAELNPDPATPYHQCLRVDLKALLDCDTVATLPGWATSNGAMLEVHVGEKLGMRITSVEALLQAKAVPA